MPVWVDTAVKLTPAFISLVVGLTASFVGFLQYRAGKDKFRFELFSKRLECFEKLHEFFADVIREGTVKETALPRLLEARQKSLFLFGPEIEKFLDEAWKKSVEINGLRSRLYGPGSLDVGPERNKVCDQETALVRWQMEQMKNSYKLYSPYLRFNR